jgi:hypothetical protein
MTPYLSVVIGIGGNVASDLQIRLGDCLLAINKFARMCSLELELILVEWNTKPLAIRLDDRAFPFRVIHTGDLHDKIPNPHGLRYREMQARNCGIRRAHGEFILGLNADDLWSRDLAAFFSRHELKQGYFYRVNRHDTIDGKVYQICWASGAFPVDTPMHTVGAGLLRALPLYDNPIHYNASGDFCLMSKDDWFKIHGNPEREYNHTVDGQTLYLAHTKGLKQIILPYPLYHPDHARTLNIGRDGKFVGPEWDDHTPFTKENGEDWGFAGMEFPETML